MLVNLHVKNLALIEEEDITFLDGLHILSGETGAGKSIILGALGLALGEKVNKESLRNPEKEALVEAVFRVTRESQRKRLSELDIEAYDDEVILSRKITESRSAAKINGEMVPASLMKQVGDIFLDVHGQNDHQSLLSKKKHLEMLDAYGKEVIGPKKEAMSAAYERLSKLRKQWQEMESQDQNLDRELDLLSYEVEEIKNAALRENEDEELEKEYYVMSHSRQIVEALGEAYANTKDGDGAAALVSSALQKIHQVLSFDENLTNLYDTISDIESLLSDLNRGISSYMDDASFDEEAFWQVENRLNEINRLKDKYGRSIPDILSALEEKEKKIDQIQNHDAYKQKLKDDLDEAQKEAFDLAEDLSNIRKATAEELSKKVEAGLLDLNFLDVYFSMEFEQCTQVGPNGFDDAQFVIRTNPGEPIRPLKDIASGGEMSRIMLAIKTVLAEHDDVDTLIFDEIDAGISGRTAQAVSEKLHLIAKKHQVICITHLPQIAAMADHHYLIQKDVVDNGTISSIEALSYHDSIKELARMLGGSAITQTVLDNAKEMKDLAQEKK